MIIILEQDTRRDKKTGRRFHWRPMLFKGTWMGKRTWRFGWGMWSISYYPSKGLRDFCDEMEHTCWYERKEGG